MLYLCTLYWNVKYNVRKLAIYDSYSYIEDYEQINLTVFAVVRSWAETKKTFFLLELLFVMFLGF